MAAPQSSNELSSWVRNYVHYDNLANNYSKQATGARKLRDDYEGRIIQNLRANGMENAIIQISGAYLQMSNDKTTPSLTIPRLESYLHKYFAQKGNSIDETEAILRFIRLQKQQDTQHTACLKRTPIATPIPPPPQGQGQIGLK
jgi:hypothetical protein